MPWIFEDTRLTNSSILCIRRATNCVFFKQCSYLSHPWWLLEWSQLQAPFLALLQFQVPGYGRNMQLKHGWEALIRVSDIRSFCRPSCHFNTLLNLDVPGFVIIVWKGFKIWKTDSWALSVNIVSIWWTNSLIPTFSGQAKEKVSVDK